MNDYGMVIVGAGEAGARAAAELRAQGWTGPLTLIGSEKQLPYERPPLSKQQLTAEVEPPAAVILDERMLSEHKIRFLTGIAVEQIDRAGHIVTLSGGSQIRYERLLLATGARPRKLTLGGSGVQSVLYLRNFADARFIRERLQPGKRVAVIGGGFIGLEVTASAIARGCSVTLIEAAPRILMRGVPEEIARMTEARHRAAGVKFQIGAGIVAIDRADHEYVISLADGMAIRCDTIVAGVGAIPETALAEGCGLELDNGIRVNEMLVSSDPDIFAAGDCCSFPHPCYENRRIRLEAWRNAQDQGTHAARNMLHSPLPYTALPWFWSDQYEQTLQVAGLTDCGERTVLRNLGEAGKLFFHLNGEGRLMAVSGMGPGGSFAKEFRLAEILIERQTRLDPESVANPANRLKDFVRA